MANDLGSMVTNIASETKNLLTTADIKRKIFEAIDAYKHHNLGFNESTATFPTIASTQEYAFSAPLPTDVIHIELMTLSYGGRPIEILPVDPNKIAKESLVTSSLPSHYGVHHNSILLYPTPNSIYTVKIWYIKDINTFDSSSPDASTNDWFTKGERLIRNFAKALLYGEILRNQNEETRSIELATRAFLDLKAKASYKRGGFQVEPWEI